jgi:hypothetical protein
VDNQETADHHLQAIDYDDQQADDYHQGEDHQRNNYQKYYGFLYYAYTNYNSHYVTHDDDTAYYNHCNHYVYFSKDDYFGQYSQDFPGRDERYRGKHGD